MYTTTTTGFQDSAQTYSSLVIPYAYSDSFNSNQDIYVNNVSEPKHLQFKSPPFRSESNFKHFENQPVHQNASTTSKCRCFSLCDNICNYDKVATPTYTGYGDEQKWHNFISLFEKVCDLNEYDTETRCKQLLISLRDEALEFADSLLVKDTKDYTRLKSALADCFSIRDDKANFLAQFKSRDQHLDESIETFLQDLWYLAERAFPEVSNSSDSFFLIIADKFIAGLINMETRKHLLLNRFQYNSKGTDMLKDLLNAAMLYETVMSTDSFGYEANTVTICESAKGDNQHPNSIQTVHTKPMNQFNNPHSYVFTETLEPNTEFSDSCCQVHDNALLADIDTCRSSSVSCDIDEIYLSSTTSQDSVFTSSYEVLQKEQQLVDLYEWPVSHETSQHPEQYVSTIDNSYMSDLLSLGNDPWADSLAIQNKDMTSEEPLQESVKSAALQLENLVSLEYKPCVISPDPRLKEDKITFGNLNPLSVLQENISLYENNNQACTSGRSSHFPTDSIPAMCTDSKILSKFTERGYPISDLDKEPVKLMLNTDIAQREMKFGSLIINKWDHLRQKKVKLRCKTDNKSTQGRSL